MVSDVRLFAECLMLGIAIAIFIVNVIRAIWEMIKWKKKSSGAKMESEE